MKIVRPLARYLVLLLALLLAGSVLLLAAGLLPQSRIETNLLESMYQLEAEDQYPHILDEQSWACMIDMYSENYIMNLSYYMNTKENPASIFTNPQKCGIAGTLHEAIEQHQEADANYARYWGGFRAAGRLLLTFFTYMQVRRLLGVVFFLLAGGTALYLYARTRSAAPALSFLIALSLLNLSVVTSTLQFSCCFLIAMAGVLLLPGREREYLTYPMYFFILGAATQYFDFYTTPILTFGFPMLALLCIRQHNDIRFTGKRMFRLTGRCFAGWLSAYILMWVGKLSLTTIFTDLDALSDGFGAAENRIFESTGGVDGSLFYRIGIAFWRVFLRVFDRPVFLAAAVLGAFAVWLFLFLRRKKTKRDIRASLAYLFVAVLPLVWFAVAAGPSIKHSWFQYRGIGVFLFGVLLFITQSTRKYDPFAVACPDKSGPETKSTD